MNSRPQRVAIIGVGSPFGADRLGWQACEWLQQSTLQQTFPQLHFTFQQSDRPGAQLLHLLRDCDSAIIIDAMQSGLPHGSLCCFTPAQLAAEHGLLSTHGSLCCFTPAQLAAEHGLLSTHGFGVADALALGYCLVSDAAAPLLPQRLVVVGVEMEGAGLFDGEALLAMTRQIVAKWFKS